jgi:hypothetical protein
MFGNNGLSTINETQQFDDILEQPHGTFGFVELVSSTHITERHPILANHATPRARCTDKVFTDRVLCNFELESEQADIFHGSSLLCVGVRSVYVITSCMTDKTHRWMYNENIRKNDETNQRENIHF